MSPSDVSERSPRATCAATAQCWPSLAKNNIFLYFCSFPDEMMKSLLSSGLATMVSWPGCFLTWLVAATIDMFVSPHATQMPW